MNYQSTRNAALTASSAEAILNGLAPDGGLYAMPALSGLDFDWQRCLTLSTQGMATEILCALLPDFTHAEMEQLVHAAYTGKFETEDLTPTVPVGEDTVLELFRGPTSAFKDVALSMLPHLMTAAKKKCGVDDEIYNAILWHTTGKPDMTVLEKVIYLADFIEPTRNFPGVDALRRTVWEDLDRGLLMGLEMTVEEMEEMGNPIHVNTLAARDYLKGKTNEGKAGSGQQL